MNESAFCSEFARDQRTCKKSLKKLKNLHKRLAEVRKRGETQVELRDSLEWKQMDREIGMNDEEDTEADGYML